MTIPNEQELPGDRPPSEFQGDDSEMESLRMALAAAEAKANESRDLYMRALAEIDNVRKRATRDIENAHKFGLDRLANELVGVRDSLELGLASEGSVDSLKAGTDATLKLLTKAFEKAGIVEIVLVGRTVQSRAPRGYGDAAVRRARAEHRAASYSEGVSVERPATQTRPSDRRSRALGSARATSYWLQPPRIRVAKSADFMTLTA